MDGPKLEWMYKNLNEVVDEEEYLLGKPIDKAFEQSQSNEIEKDCLPTSIFANAGSNVQVDVIRKLKEDPLEAIKRQEIEKRKQLLKNPVQLKKLQDMLKMKDGSGSMKSKKTIEKKQREDDASSDIDKLLASKYRKIMKKHGIKSLSELTNIKVERKNKSKKSRKSSDESSSSSSEDSSDEEDNKKNKAVLREKRVRRSTSSDTSSDQKKKPSHSHRTKGSDNNVKERNYYKNRDYKKAHPKPSSERTSSDRYRRDDRNKNHRTSSRRDFSYERNSRVGRSESKDKKYKNNGLSETEKQKRLEEMMNNAKWRDDVRSKNIARYKKEESSETNDKYREDFLRKQMGIMLAKSNDTVESRIKSNINNIQKSKSTMNENFMKR